MNKGRRIGQSSYRNGDSLRKIVADLEQRHIPFPAEKSRWNQEPIDKLLSNEKYAERLLLQKAISTCITKPKMMASWSGTSIPAPVTPSFPIRYLWQYSRRNSNGPKRLHILGSSGSAVWALEGM